VLYANEALQRIVRANDGIKIVKRKIVFAAVDAATRLASALASAARLHAGDPDFGADPDFAAARPSRVPPMSSRCARSCTASPWEPRSGPRWPLSSSTTR
jgi:hypothetical protein